MVVVFPPYLYISSSTLNRVTDPNRRPEITRPRFLGIRGHRISYQGELFLHRTDFTVVTEETPCVQLTIESVSRYEYESWK